MSTAVATTENAFRRCARLLQDLHRLIDAGQDDSDEAEALRAEMDPLWYAMSAEERDRLGGLSEDLYILTEGGARQAKMSSDEKARWSEEANAVLSAMFAERDMDGALKFLRRPIPADYPRCIVPFFQARCWERLGEEELALRFMKEAARLDPHQAVCVLIMAEEFGRTDDAAEYAARIIDNQDSSAEELYQAAATVLRPAREMSLTEAEPILRRIIAVLARALRIFRTAARERRHIQDSERYIFTLLGFCHQQLGEVKTAVQFYSDGLARYPRDAELRFWRGLALIDLDQPEALSDFRLAVELGSLSIWPYYFLALDSIRRGNYAETWQLCLQALQRPGPDSVKARLNEWLGIAMAELGQPIDWVLRSFGLAEALDPENPRIRHNRAVAEGEKTPQPATKENRWKIDGKASSTQALRDAYPKGRLAPGLVFERAETNLAALVGSPAADR
jgi:tetratricopeptide (TPR) repeat protein